MNRRNLIQSVVTGLTTFFLSGLRTVSGESLGSTGFQSNEPSHLGADGKKYTGHYPDESRFFVAREDGSVVYNLGYFGLWHQVADGDRDRFSVEYETGMRLTVNGWSWFENYNGIAMLTSSPDSTVEISNVRPYTPARAVA